jgi:flagellin-like protein
LLSTIAQSRSSERVHFMLKANRYSRNDRAVSSILGVFLMVLVTVVLAAVVAALVFGTTQGVEQKKSVLFTVKRIDSKNLQVTFHNNGGALTVKGLHISSPIIADVIASDTTVNVGQTVTITDNALAGKVHLIASSMVDGKPCVVIDMMI